MKKSFFTLAELVMIVAVLAVLSVLVLPGRAADAAKTTSCADNLRKIGQTMSQYAQTYDDFVPGLYQAPTVTAAEFRWSMTMAKFGGDPRPYCCPDSKAYATHGAKLAQYDSQNPRDSRNLSNFVNAVSVGVNGFFGVMKQFKAFEYSGRKLHNIVNAEKLSYAADVVGCDPKLYPNNAGQTVGSYYGPRVVPARGAALDPRHDSAANVLFADGHVDVRSKETLAQMCAAWSKAPNIGFFLVNR